MVYCPSGVWMVPVCWHVLVAAVEAVPAAAGTVVISRRSAARVAMAAIAPVRGWRDFVGTRSVLPSQREGTPARHAVHSGQDAGIPGFLGALPQSVSAFSLHRSRASVPTEILGIGDNAVDN